MFLLSLFTLFLFILSLSLFLFLFGSFSLCVTETLINQEDSWYRRSQFDACVSLYSLFFLCLASYTPIPLVQSIVV
jgi:hypothetical protein